MLMDEIRSLGKQLDLCKQTISKQAADLSRLRRNHGFDMRLLQKTINNLQHNISKDSKSQAELAERVIKLSTERDILKLQESSSEEQSLTLKQSLISVMNERNQLIRELRLGPNPSHLSDVLVLGPSRIGRLSTFKSEPFQVDTNIEYIDLREDT
jgi:chromosome segregation ATPase